MLPIFRLGAFSCYLRIKLAILSLFHGNSHGNGSTDHGVVAHAQEAHHFHVKSACRRLCACGARLFCAANPTFHKSGNTSLIPIECAFLTSRILSHLLSTKQVLLTNGRRVQPVGACHDTKPCALWYGECESQGEANRQAAGGQGGHSRKFSETLSCIQKRNAECFGIGKGLLFEQDNGL